MDIINEISGAVITWTTATPELLQNMVVTPTENVSNSIASYFLFDPAILSNNIFFYVIVLFWLLVIVWVIKDSNYRSNSTGFVIFSLLLVTIGTPLVWLPLYLAIRPLGYKYEREYRKALMTQQTDEEQDDDIVILTQWNNEEDDEDHLVQLKKQATVSKRRITRSSSKTATKTPSSNAKSSVTKTTTKVPVAKKATTRGGR